MDKFLFGLTAVFAKMPNRVLRSKRLVLVVLALVSIGMFYAMATRTVFDLSSESFMQDESPAQIALDEFRRQFAGGCIYISHTDIAHTYSSHTRGIKSCSEIIERSILCDGGYQVANHLASNFTRSGRRNYNWNHFVIVARHG